jgi:hypothetical protein
VSFVAAFIFGLAAGLFGYAWISAPERRRQRHRATTAIAAAKKARSERDEALGDVDYWRSQYHGGVDAIIDRLHAAATDETPLHDRLVLEAMERQFENGGGL